MSLLVRNVMAEAPETASPQTTVREAARRMADLDIGVLPVTDGERLIGLVTDRDLVVRGIAEHDEAGDLPLADVLTGDELVTATTGMQVSEARELMARYRVRRLPVVEGDRLVGIVSLGDVAETSGSTRAVGETLREISESPATTGVNPGSPDPGTPERVLERRREAG